MKESKHKKIGTVMAVIAGVLLVVCGIFLPGVLLGRMGKRELGVVEPAPENYYQASYSAMARNSSAKLETTEKLQLVTGQWDSTLEEPQAFERELSDYEVAKMAQQGVRLIYQQGWYPEDIMGYENWYSWEVTSYKAVDTTFHTYTAYYFRILFQKYDGTISHKVYMLDNGTVFFAEADYKDGVELKRMKGLHEGEEKGSWTEEWKKELQFTDIDISAYTDVVLLPVEDAQDSYELLRAESGQSSIYFRIP